MLTFEFNINLLILGAVVLASVLIGFSMKTRQLVRNRLRIVELEKEMLNNYAEILELQKDYINMESKLRASHIPVIPIKTVLKDAQDGNEKIPDISLRKKLLSKENLLRQSVGGK